MSSPTISICIPSHNCGPYLGLAIESALRQIAPANEVIVSDDHSTDNSLEVLARYRVDPRVRVIVQAERLTLGEHYRSLLHESTSDFVAFLSADDALLPTFTVEMARPANAAVSFVVGAAVETDERLRPRRTRGTARRQKLSAGAGFRYFASGNYYTVSTSMMRRTDLIALPDLPPEFDLATDWYWALMLAKAGTVAFTRRPVGYYRVHATNAGHGNTRWHAASRHMRRWLAEQLQGADAQILLKAVGQEEGPALSNKRPLRALTRDLLHRANALRYAPGASAARRSVPSDAVPST